MYLLGSSFPPDMNDYHLQIFLIWKRLGHSSSYCTERFRKHGWHGIIFIWNYLHRGRDRLLDKMHRDVIVAALYIEYNLISAWKTWSWSCVTIWDQFLWEVSLKGILVASYNLIALSWTSLSFQGCNIYK